MPTKTVLAASAMILACSLSASAASPVRVTVDPALANPRQPQAADAVKLAGAAWEPVVAASVAGQGPVVAVWESGSGKNTAIMSLVVAER